MTNIPSVRPKKLLKFLKKRGFFIHHQKGSHIVLKSIHKPNLRVTLPMHNKDLKRKTLLSILKQANISVKELIKKRVK